MNRDSVGVTQAPSSRQPTPTARPIRVLHTVGRLHRGGVESWLLNLARIADPAIVQFDILLQNPAPGELEPDFERLGCRLIRGGGPRPAYNYTRRIVKLLREYGPYDVVHAHSHHFAGQTLAAASRAGVPARIAHSHLDTRAADSSSGILRRLYLAAMSARIQRFATSGLAASEEAAVSLFGRNWKSDPRWQILTCGIEVAALNPSLREPKLRDALGLSRKTLVLGHVGRLAAQKNQEFLVDVLAEVRRRHEDTCLLLIGEGPDRQMLERRVRETGQEEHVLFLGSRGDVPQLLSSVVDVFAFPSLFEGLGLAVVEAQAAGLPSVIADTVPGSAVLLPKLVAALPLAAGPSVWAEECIRRWKTSDESVSEAWNVVASSTFAIEHSLKKLLDHYHGEVPGLARHRCLELLSHAA
ncbi:MAG: glycosyltransferase [Planctomycetaceae bacterium]|nr:glycosyltransferase [Planctomycetaceae bacterium]